MRSSFDFRFFLWVSLLKVKHPYFLVCLQPFIQILEKKKMKSHLLFFSQVFRRLHRKVHQDDSVMVMSQQGSVFRLFRISCFQQWPYTQQHKTNTAVSFSNSMLQNESRSMLCVCTRWYDRKSVSPHFHAGLSSRIRGTRAVLLFGLLS